MIAALLIFAQIGTVQFHVRKAPDTVYVGQQVTYDAVTLVDYVARTHLRANPEYTPPDVRGVTLYDFRFDSTFMSDVVIGGVPFRQYIYRRAMFPLSPGEYDIPPATLQYALPDEESFFSKQISYTLHSDSTHFVAIPLPPTGRPLDFNDVVGEFTDSAFTDGAQPRVGDPFVLTLRVLGVGNITLLPRPILKIAWADAVESTERVQWDSTGSVVRGIKEFDWIVTPRVGGHLFIPPIRYDYFNPNTATYTYTASQTIPVVVSGGTTTRPDTIHTPHDTIGTTPFPLIVRTVSAHWQLAAGVAIGILVLIVIAAFWAVGHASDEDSE